MRRSGGRSTETCAAAPATKRSSNPLWTGRRNTGGKKSSAGNTAEPTGGKMSLPASIKATDTGATAAPYDDVREWLKVVDDMGELKRIDGANWDLEIGAIAELVYRERTGAIPALLFDQIKGYPKGFRIL